MSFRFQQSATHLQKWIISLGLLLLVVLAGCNSPQPIDTGNPISFKHRSGVFEMQVPKSWKQAQDQVETESLAAFSDPSGRAEMIGYAGLLDHTLTDDEGLATVPGLVKNLLNAPQDLAITDQQHRSDGAFTLNLSFTRNNEKRSGQAIFRQGALALSGVIVSGPQSEWTTLLTALQPYIDSFTLKPDFVQGTYFTPIENVHFAVVIPADWGRQTFEGGTLAKSPANKFTIVASEIATTTTSDDAALAKEATSQARAHLGAVQLDNQEKLPDGRTKLSLSQGTQRVIGYYEVKDGMLISLFFSVPADRADAYQPIIDFMYSTWVTGKP
ncbi:MAG: hypothetical protein U0559_14460 [Anaerolineae bacterium]